MWVKWNSPILIYEIAFESLPSPRLSKSLLDTTVCAKSALIFLGRLKEILLVEYRIRPKSPGLLYMGQQISYAIRWKVVLLKSFWKFDTF